MPTPLPENQMPVLDLATKEGVEFVKGQWRYSDTKIIPVDFKAAGPDKQPTGKPIKTYDFTPHAGGADFDIRNGKCSIRRHSTHGVRQGGFVSIGTESILQYLGA